MIVTGSSPAAMSWARASASGTKYTSVIAPSRSSRYWAATRMPVDIASIDPASTAWAMGVSAPSSWISANANG